MNTSDALNRDRQFIIRNVNDLPLEDRIYVGRMIFMQCPDVTQQYCNEGTVINFNLVPAPIVEDIRKYIVAKQALLNW
jgi:hypothetical protein